MTIAEILYYGYGIDLSTLDFKMCEDVDNPMTKEEVIEHIKNDKIICDGRFVGDFELYGDKPTSFVELYKEEE